jgi:SAM-dependent methyltransferase
VNRQPAWPAVADPAEHYERYQAPAFSVPWAKDLLDAVDPRPGERVLDVACRTGAVAHAAARRVRPGGTVVGLDQPDPGLRRARGGPDAGVQWRRGHASSLPFGDGSFDVVLCQQGLQFLPDRGGALAEMWRVLVPLGRVGVAVWGPIERSPAFAALADSLERHAGVGIAAAVRWLFSLSEPDDLRALLAGAGFGGILVRRARGTARFPSVAEFLRRCVPGSPVGAATMLMSGDDQRRVVADLETELAPWVDADGLRIATEINTGVASR